MQPDATYKYVLSSAFMVEELMRWLVAERHGLHALVEALDFSTLTRVHEQSVTGDSEALLDSHRVGPEVAPKVGPKVGPKVVSRDSASRCAGTRR